MKNRQPLISLLLPLIPTNFFFAIAKNPKIPEHQGSDMPLLGLPVTLVLDGPGHRRIPGHPRPAP